MTSFQGLGLAPHLLRALDAQSYSNPTPIQAQAIPPLLEGRDVLGIAQTGTGKTAAFALPLLHKIAAAGKKARPGRPIALILSPTRELAHQITVNTQGYARHQKVRTAAVFGGVPIRRQIEALRRGVDVLVATPGRLMDLLNQRCLSLDDVETFVLDEADRMLDLGFVNDVRRIATALRQDRQTVLFSATMPASIKELADSFLTDPVRVSVTPEATTAERVDQRVLFVDHVNKKPVLRHLLADETFRRVLVFTRTKHRADQVARFLCQNEIGAAAIHGNKAQNARQRALNDFKAGRVRVLVATDIAARGIDVDEVTHVINFELPDVPESYVHRIGRTARAGARGIAISLCDTGEHGNLRDIQKAIRMTVPVVSDHPHASSPMPTRAPGQAPGRKAGPKPARKSGHKVGHKPGQKARGKAPGKAPAKSDGKARRRPRRKNAGARTPQSVAA